MARPAIVFIGFMGAGKSTALAAAREAGLETTEIDALMEAAFGKPISQAFEEDGEEAFRAREAEVVGELLERADGGAIALGGGSIFAFSMIVPTASMSASKIALTASRSASKKLAIASRALSHHD